MSRANQVSGFRLRDRKSRADALEDDTQQLSQTMNICSGGNQQRFSGARREAHMVIHSDSSCTACERDAAIAESHRSRSGHRVRQRRCPLKAPMVTPHSNQPRHVCTRVGFRFLAFRVSCVGCRWRRSRSQRRASNPASAPIVLPACYSARGRIGHPRGGGV